MARAPSRPQAAPELLRPTASPVDSFVRPAPSGLHQIADAFGNFAPELNALTNQRAQRFREEEAIRAEADFLKNNQEGFAEGVRQGRLPAHQSRTYMRTYKAAEGAAIGNRLQHQYRAAWDAWEGKNQEDPDGSLHNGFLQDFIARNVGTEDPDVLAGVLPAVRSLQDTATAADIKYRADRAYLGSITAHGARVHQHIDDAEEAGLLAPEGVNYSAVFARAFEERERIVASGARPEDFDKTMMEAFAAKALEKGDAGLLAWFDQTVPGQDYTYGDTAEGLALRQQTQDRLETARRQAASDEYARQTRDDAAAKDDATRTAVDLLAAGEPVPEELLAAGQRVDPTFRTRIAEWHSSLSERPSDPEAIQAVYADILAGGGVQAVVRAFDAGVIANPEDLTKLHTFAKGFEGEKERIQETLSGPTSRGILDTIDVRTKGSNRAGDPVGGISNDGLAAQADYRRMVSDWVLANPNASTLEREDAANRIGRIILDAIGTPGRREAGGDYERPGAITTPNAHAGSPEWPSRPAPPAPTQEAAPEPTGEWRWYNPGSWFGRDAEPTAPDAMPSAPTAAPVQSPLDWLNAQPEARRAAVENFAQQNGIPVEEAARGLQRQLNERSTTEPAPGSSATYQPMSYAPGGDTDGADSRSVGLTPEQASRFLDEALSASTVDTTPGSTFIAGDPTASRLLNLIGHHEATNNYNAVWGNAKSTIDLSQFTLDQILGQQQRARAAGKASTAIGKYQFIYKTLGGLKEELGLTGKERFTPQLQDRLGMQLLERRGYSAFRQGRITQRQFAFRLSQEWASLANPNTGRSFYDGDGLNASSASAQDVYRALGLGGMAANSNRPAVQPVSLGGAPAPASSANAYANIPEAERPQFLQWNSDPVGNHEANLASIEPDLSNVIRRAQQLTGVSFVVGSGRRDADLQAKAVEWGWSKTHDSDHLHGGAVDLWGLDPNGAVTFDPETQAEIVRAMKQAAQELGVDLDVGADWRGFKDNPHFALRGRRA